MALTCNWSTKLITVPKSDLTLVSGTQYSLTVSYWFQLLRELNGGVEGIAQTIGEPLYNNTPPTSSTPRIVDVINGYTVEVEDGLYNLEIINVIPDCSCTSPEWSTEIVRPGMNGYIIATYDSHEDIGKFLKTITVLHNAGEGFTFLEISGFVSPKL